MCSASDPSEKHPKAARTASLSPIFIKPYPTEVGYIFRYVHHQARRDFSFSQVSYFFSLNISVGLHWQRFHISSCSIFIANGMKIGWGAEEKDDFGVFDS